MNLLTASALFLSLLYLFWHVSEDPKFKPAIDKARMEIRKALEERKERKQREKQ